MNRAATFTGRLTAAALAAFLGLTGLFALTAAPASAAPQVSVSGQPPADGPGELQLSGSGFQSVEGGFGGIYVLFGWVSDPQGGSWRPSQNGVTGRDYRYQYDDETNPEGYQLFVTFPGSSTASAANGGELSADGTWSGTLKTQGAVFDTFDRQGNRETLDCTQVQCGIITIGAHGVKNANNESFTPVDFSGAGEAGAAGDDGGNADEGEAAAGDQASEEPAEEAPAAAAVPETAAPVAAPLIDPTSLAEGTRMFTLLLVLLAVAVVLGLSIIGLSFGIGGYLAAKSLLLGVSPEALERERGKRERRAIKAREKRKRKTDAVRRREELRTVRAQAKNSSQLARGEMEQLPPAAESYDEIVRFFENDPNTPPAEPAYPAPGSGAGQGPGIDPEAPTTVQPAVSGRRETGEPATAVVGSVPADPDSSRGDQRGPRKETP
ncbi:hypothetical protein [Sediminivirga luteola]|uniref:Minor silk ampullate protein n=1 Tax=Sediminivirga luteola TaxID=1774748 RepID=A0A8J2U0W9_9MICO|nr:hypothetical protein [Sediminivirga luteola]GGA26793.1 hypothetical protein GCM10011333_32020 [Sediminivirga luteola]